MGENRARPRGSLVPEGLVVGVDDLRRVLFDGATRHVDLLPAARAEELRRYGVSLLENKPALESGEQWESWLVRAESLLAQVVYEGRSLPEAAEQLGISVNTTRTQLRSIFGKVGVHSQAELLRELTKNFFHA